MLYFSPTFMAVIMWYSLAMPRVMMMRMMMMMMMVMMIAFI